MTTADAKVELVARLVEPEWFTDDGRPPIINNYPDQHLAYQERARDKARAIITALEASHSMTEAMIGARKALQFAYDMHSRARNTIPDEEEGLAAQVFCHHINQTDGPIIEALGKLDEALAMQAARPIAPETESGLNADQEGLCRCKLCGADWRHDGPWRLVLMHEPTCPSGPPIAPVQDDDATLQLSDAIGAFHAIQKLFETGQPAEFRELAERQINFGLRQLASLSNRLGNQSVGGEGRG